MKLFAIPLFVICAFSFASAQVSTILYETFEIPDSANALNLEIVGELTVTPWSSNQVMTQTEVLIEGGSSDILVFFEKEGRYDIALDSLSLSNSYALRSMDAKRPVIQYKGQNCFEQVKVRVFVPRGFEMSTDSLHWVRP